MGFRLKPGLLTTAPDSSRSSKLAWVARIASIATCSSKPATTFRSASTRIDGASETGTVSELDISNSSPVSDFKKALTSSRRFPDWSSASIFNSGPVDSCFIPFSSQRQRATSASGVTEAENVTGSPVDSVLETGAICTFVAITGTLMEMELEERGAFGAPVKESV